MVVSSTIQTLEIITGGFAPEFGAQTAAVRSDRPVWFPLALAAFGLLLVEWWFYQRRAVRSL